MRRYEILKDERKWDQFREFHVNRHPVTYFETGELILLSGCPSVDNRRRYPEFGIELITTSDYKGSLWAPDGTELLNAWLYDNGQQHLLIDHSTGRIVRTDGRTPYRGQDGELRWAYGGEPCDPRPGIPERFQTNAYAYIGGPGCVPIGCAKITAYIPTAKVGYSPEQREHIAMITNTARAAMKLTNHPAAGGHMGERGFHSGVSPEILLQAKTWLDVPESYFRQLYHFGAGRLKREFDYVLVSQPK